MYRKFAEERESEGHFGGSIEYWAKSLEAAKAAGDQAALGQACYRLGKAYTELEDPTRYAFSLAWLSGRSPCGYPCVIVGVVNAHDPLPSIGRYVETCHAKSETVKARVDNHCGTDRYHDLLEYKGARYVQSMIISEVMGAYHRISGKAQDLVTEAR